MHHSSLQGKTSGSTTKDLATSSESKPYSRESLCGNHPILRIRNQERPMTLSSQCCTDRETEALRSKGLPLRQPASLQPESRPLKAPLQTHASLSYKSSAQPDYSSLEHLIGDVSTSALASSTDFISTWVQWVMCIVHTQLCDDASKLVELSQRAGTGELTQRFHPGIT